MSTVVRSQAVRRLWWWFFWSLLTALAIAIAVYFVPPYLSGGSRFHLEREIVG
jgi:hypothetical protein